MSEFEVPEPPTIHSDEFMPWAVDHVVKPKDLEVDPDSEFADWRVWKP